MRSSATTKATWSRLRTSSPLSQSFEQNIALTGIMAVGKSAVGKRLARRMKRPFVDLDKMIEKNEGMKVREIFSRKGEPYFRKLERQVLQDVLRQDGQVIATGGGVVMYDDNLRLLREKSFLICLTASSDILIRRAGKGRQRPLLQGTDKRSRLDELMQQREKNYGQAHATVDTSYLSVGEVVEKIVELLANANCTPQDAKSV